jgi:putative hydrolase of the HAD superfamily
MGERKYKALFCDIGGVLGTNGWDGELRRQVTEYFGLESAQVDARHRLMFDSFERGFITFDQYLERVFFSQPRAFSMEAVRQYTYAASQPWTENIEFVRFLRNRNSLKLALISNEGEGITQYRVEKFGLRELADFLVISHFVHFRKPDPEIWKLALNLAQVNATESIYIDDREMFAEAAAKLGFTAIHHVSLEITRDRFAALGLEVS